MRMLTRRAVLGLAAAVAAGAAPGSAPRIDPLLVRARALAQARPDIWAGARLTRGAACVVLGGTAPLRTELAALADAACRQVARIWGTAPAAVLLLPATTGQAAALAAPAPVAGFAALAAADHVIIEPAGFARLSAAGRRVVLAHELTHLATGAAVAAVPKWLSEGFADYVGYRDSGIPVRTAAAELAAEVRAGTLPRALPGPADFAADAPRLPQAYQEAWLACRYVAARFGERALVTLYRRVQSGEDPARALGMGAGEFIAAWRAHVREELG